MVDGFAALLRDRSRCHLTQGSDLFAFELLPEERMN